MSRVRVDRVDGQGGASGGFVLAGAASAQLKTQGYGGHPMRVRVHRRQPGRLAGWLEAAGFGVEAWTRVASAESRQGAMLFARRGVDAP
ncbi:hypothetical protein [Streptacidiphilus monticola]|uniref:Uncharacterized protein n=1 Tax=Streptacidiphilus monticola TaxID=2161674 RepID=A0ABW1G4F7_9ACTN